MTATPLPPRVTRVDVYRGDTWEFPTYELLDENGDPENLTGHTWLAQWRSEPDSSTAIALTVDSSDAADGLIKVTASAVQTAQFTDLGYWDLQSTNSGVVKTWLYGSVRCVKDTSRA